MKARFKPIAVCAVIALVCLVSGCSGLQMQSGTEPTEATEADTVADTVNAITDNQAVEAAVAAVDSAGRAVGDVVTQAASALKEPHSVDSVDAANAVDLHFGGSGLDTVSDGVSTEGSTVTISQAGTYRLTGTLEGNLVVQAPDDAKVALILDGVSISSPTSSAIAILGGDEATVQLAPNSRNVLADADADSVSESDENVPDGEEDANSEQDETGEDLPNAALYSTADMSITGEGELVILGNQNDGIASQDSLVIDSGTISVTAADDGIRGKDYLVISGGKIIVESNGHAIKSDNTEDVTKGFVHVTDVTVAASSKEEDGFNAQYVLLGTGANTIVNAGDDGLHGDLATIVDTDNLLISDSNEGIEGAAVLLVNGTVDVTSTDDGINASDGSGAAGPGRDMGSDAGNPGAGGGNQAGDPGLDAGNPGAGGGNQGGNPGSGRGNPGENPGMMGATDGVMLLISGGNITLQVDGDGLDSNGSAKMTGGVVTVNGPTRSGNGTIDVASGLVIFGGTLIAGGASGMAEAPSSDSVQGWVWANISVSAGQQVNLVDSNGTELVTYEPAVDVGNVVISDVDVVAGETYQIQVLDSGNVASTADVVAGEADQAGGMNPGFGGGGRGGGPGGEG